MKSLGGTNVYPSKRDLLLTLLIWAVVLGVAFAAFNLWNAPESFAFKVVTAIMMWGAVAFTIWVFYTTRYILHDRELMIRAGPFRWRVPLEGIEKVYPTRNPLSSPACSLDRLRIRYRGSGFGVMISPEDKGAFLRDLVSREPGLELDGERVSRVAG
jgi:hypothetical protein